MIHRSETAYNEGGDEVRALIVRHEMRTAELGFGAAVYLINQANFFLVSFCDDVAGFSIWTLR